MTPDPRAPAVLRARVERVRAAMTQAGVDVLLLSLGADLPWLTGYTPTPLERLTMLVLLADGDDDATLVVPALEAPRVAEVPDVLCLRPWQETEDPVDIVAALVGARRDLAVSDRTWGVFVLGLQRALPRARWRAASCVTAPLRAVKDEAELAALSAAGAAADRVAEALITGAIPLTGRTELEVSAEIGHRLRAEGHDRVNFLIVGSGPNAASPHHDPGHRVIEPGDPVVCDFGGTMGGYCSDITRTVVAGGAKRAAPTAKFEEIYDIVARAQSAALASVRAGTACEDVDAVARDLISAAGHSSHFIHRTGHGIGLEEHEDPYLVAGNRTPLVPGHVVSVEPGIYLPGLFGVRIEDIVVATADGPCSLNHADHALTVVDA